MATATPSTVSVVRKRLRRAFLAANPIRFM
jgi:hypothetical protein